MSILAGIGILPAIDNAIFLNTHSGIGNEIDEGVGLVLDEAIDDVMDESLCAAISLALIGDVHS
jgi:hypothetical protein